MLLNLDSASEEWVPSLIIIEAFFDEGRAYLMSTFFPDDSDQSLEIFSSGGDTKLVSMDIYELKSSWDHE